MNSFLHRVCLLFLLLAVIPAAAKEDARGRIYSDVHAVDDGGAGELVGTELELKIDGSKATGIVRIYQGGCAEPVPVTGSFSGNTINVSGEGEGFGKIEITGHFRHGHLDGSLQLDRIHHSEKIRLGKIRKPHC